LRQVIHRSRQNSSYVGLRLIGASGVMGLVLNGLALFVSWSSAHAGDISLMAVGLRYGLSGSSPIGEQTQTDFHQYDVAATLRLPWQWFHSSGWGLSTRLLVSGGALNGAHETNLIATAVPVLAFGRNDDKFSVDMGGGGALLSDHKFGVQNFGGPFQFVWTFGANLGLIGPLGISYHFQHYSDATLYGHDSRGVDLHMFELAYRF
jgi:hypothetical protein